MSSERSQDRRAFFRGGAALIANTMAALSISKVLAVEQVPLLRNKMGGSLEPYSDIAKVCSMVHVKIKGKRVIGFLDRR